jgi:hypothetical protein
MMAQMVAFVAGQALRFRYTNYRGVTSVREVRPVYVRWGTSDYYPEPGWLMKALDFDRGEFREFSMASMDFDELESARPRLPLLREISGGTNDAG